MSEFAPSNATNAPPESAYAGSCFTKSLGDTDREVDSAAIAEYTVRTFEATAAALASSRYQESERNHTVASTASTVITTMSSARVKPFGIMERLFRFFSIYRRYMLNRIIS